MELSVPPSALAATHAAVREALPLTRVVGCGNLYAGDDAVGPLVVGRLAAANVPHNVTYFDAGTSGIDAALAFRGASEVIMIDACRSGQAPGTIFELSGEEISSQSDSAGPNFHTLRWDQAIAIARQCCQPGPQRISVFLVEGRNFSLGDAVTPAVANAVEELAAGLQARLQQSTDPEPDACHRDEPESDDQPKGC